MQLFCFKSIDLSIIFSSSAYYNTTRKKENNGNQIAAVGQEPPLPPTFIGGIKPLQLSIWGEKEKK
jgi:hypothetical protein